MKQLLLIAALLIGVLNAAEADTSSTPAVSAELTEAEKADLAALPTAPEITVEELKAGWDEGIKKDGHTYDIHCEQAKSIMKAALDAGETVCCISTLGSSIVPLISCDREIAFLYGVSYNTMKDGAAFRIALTRRLTFEESKNIIIRALTFDKPVSELVFEAFSTVHLLLSFLQDDKLVESFTRYFVPKEFQREILPKFTKLGSTVKEAMPLLRRIGKAFSSGDKEVGDHSASLANPAACEGESED